MFKYMGKVFVTVDEVRKKEREEKGTAPSHKAVYATLEALRKQCFLAKRRHGKQTGYTVVRSDKEAVEYDERRKEALELIEKMGGDIRIEMHTGCF